MLVGIDASRAFPAQRTGVEEYAYRLLVGLSATSPVGVRVRLYVSAEFEDLQLPAMWEIKMLKGPPRLWTHTALAWELFRNPPDVFFQPAHVLPFWGIKNQESRIKKMVMTIHDVGFARIPWAYSRFDRWYQHFMTRRAVISTRVRMIVPSEFTKRELMESYHVPGSRITIIPHASNHQLPTADYQPPVDPCGFSYILSIGRIEKKKNTLGMIQMFETGVCDGGGMSIEVGGWHYVLIGPDGYGADEVYDYLAERPALQSRVHLLGYVDEQRKWSLLKGACALLHLSRYEGFGLPIAEARALGIPVVTSDTLAIIHVEPERAWKDVAQETWAVLLSS